MNAVSFARVGTIMKASKTKIAAVLFFIVLGIVLFPGMKLNAAEESSGSCGENVTWKLDSEGTLTISGTGAMNNYSAAGSPFVKNTEIKKVVINSGVTSIGSGLFLKCSNLTNITIPNSVTSIGDLAFLNCTNLTNITIPNSVTYIGAAAFGSCDLTSITIPNSVTSIGNSTFENCTSLTNITISNSVTSIGDRAFQNCTSLTNITIPNSVTSIGEKAFLLCPNLTSITIPKSVTSIGPSAFSYCSNLTSITIEKSLYEQCKDAFPGISSDKFHFYYDLKCTTDGNGSVMGPSDTFDSSAETLTMSPNKGFTVDKVTWSDGIGDPVELKAENGKYTMPKPSDSFNYGSDTVTIKVFFKKVEYEITFKNDDGTVLESKKVTYGETPSYTGTATPTKESDGQYEYTFSGWSPEITTVTGDATYFAIYDKKEIKYKVAFVDIDGNEICSDDVGYLEVPVFNGKTPTKPESATSTFVFAGWNDGKTTYQLTESLPQTKADTTFKPMFKEVKKPVYTVGEVKGDGLKSDIVIDVHRDSDDENCIDYFSKATIDGTEMTIGDQYTAEKGSTIITIKKEFLSTLPAGEHEVQVVFNDGTISTKVKIAAKPSVPATGEVTGPATYIGIALVVAACACGAGVVLSKKRKEA